MNIYRIGWLVLLCLPVSILAQESYSSASISRNQSHGIQSAKQVVVEEYMNYHRHNIPLPKGGQDLSMELRWANPYPAPNTNPILQIGLAAPKQSDFSDMEPLNISIVIDQSGSMIEDHKMQKVKEALIEFVRGLRYSDRVSLITYDNEARVALNNGRVGDGNHLIRAIQNLQAGGNTNLYDGMILGVVEAQRWTESTVSRVILLTDGIANMGITNPSQIANEARRISQRGIQISTIGVGHNVNYTLLEQIAKNSGGQHHFVGNGREEIEKVFRNELQGLLFPVAERAILEVTYPEGMVLKKVFGYNPEYYQNGFRIELDPINYGLTQVFLVEFHGDRYYNKMGSIDVRLHYDSGKEGVRRTLLENTFLKSTRSPAYIPFRDMEVKKNYVIAYMAEGLKEIGRHIESGQSYQARTTAQSIRSYVRQQYPNLRDDDILKVLKQVEAIAGRDEISIYEGY